MGNNPSRSCIQRSKGCFFGWKAIIDSWVGMIFDTVCHKVVGTNVIFEGKVRV